MGFSRALIVVFGAELMFLRAGIGRPKEVFKLLKLDDVQPQKPVQSHEKDYCSDTGEVCVYHKICYDTGDSSWKSIEDPPSNAAPLLNDRGRRERKEEDPVGGCNEEFSPRKAEVSNLYSNADSLIVHGTTYLVCCAYNHFGHILVNIAVAAFHALTEVGLGGAVELNSVTFLIENRFKNGLRPNQIVMSVFEFLTGVNNSNRVLSLPAVVEKAKMDSKRNVCFERLVTGMLHDSLLANRIFPTAPRQEIGMLESIREHMTNLHPSTQESRQHALDEAAIINTGDVNAPPSCTITFLDRGKEAKNRKLLNFDALWNVTQHIFHEPQWSLRTVTFGGSTSLPSQYRIVRDSMVYISVAGTGSHWSMFLGDGATSVEIKYDNRVPAYINDTCATLPSLNCAVCNSIHARNLTLDEAKKGNVEVDLPNYRAILQPIHDQLRDRCFLASKRGGP